jgi:hypothetical protein
MPNSKPESESVKPAAVVPSPPATAPGSDDAPASTPEPSQAKLDAAAAKAAEKAQKEADEAAAAAQAAVDAQQKADDYGEPRAPHCPECNARMEKYAGDNPHKQSTAVCEQHGRMRVYRNKVVD